MNTRETIGPDGVVLLQLIDSNTLELVSEEPVALERQPLAVRAKRAAESALMDWQLIRDFHADIVAGGLSEWQQVAADAGLPTSQAAYDTAAAFLLARRRKAASRALAAINRWRLA